MHPPVIVIDLLARFDLLGLVVERNAGQRTDRRTNGRPRDTVTTAADQRAKRSANTTSDDRVTGAFAVTRSAARPSGGGTGREQKWR
ncbi:MAG: hypothetical protein COZ47_09880 [Lysobacterales bacterium CG_4_10_14_3_um_filter_64_11]|nr:MAG: hypothetical protein COZ47_09880 [Xanthomonadales bacterium CG_4_10_14_3_um_filter_64_11]